MDYEVKRCGRVCCVTGRPFAPGETIVSALHWQSGQLERNDYSLEAWAGPTDKTVAWWKVEIVPADHVRPPATPAEVLLRHFQDLETRPDQADVRYVLGLLLVRKKRLTQSEAFRDEAGHEYLVLLQPPENQAHVVRVHIPDAQRMAAIHAELAQLLGPPHDAT